MNNIPEAFNIDYPNELSVQFSLSVTHDLPFFPGHFPQESVLPGVVMLDWVVQFAEQLLPIKIDFEGMEAIKFKQVVRPEITLRVELTFKPEKERLVYKISSENAEHSSGKIGICKPAS
jgi:3-hydroxymyristoyl/3-hydroxydecanoyl-(acyl carrier protein) dehydratase